MKHTHYRFICAGIGLPLMFLAATAASADDKTTGATPTTITAPAETTTVPATADPQETAEQTPGEQKHGRLQFRAATGTCACTCAKGGLSEADIHRAEELRASAKN